MFGFGGPAVPNSFVDFLFAQGVIVIGAAANYAVAWLAARTRQLKTEEE